MIRNFRGRRICRRSTVIILLAFALAAACHDNRPLSYIRLAGQAPTISDVPAAPALLVVFWATWCPPCRAETPDLRALAANPPKDLRVVFVSQDITDAAVEDFFNGPPDAALHLRLDPDRKLFNAFRVDTLPASFLTVDGQLRARFMGSRHWDGRDMRALLERLIAEGKGKERP